jgi:hypothetical protein
VPPSGRERACKRAAARRPTVDADARRWPTIHLLGLSRRVNNQRLPSGRDNVTGYADFHVRRWLALEHALKEYRGFGEPARASEARGLSHLVRIKHVIHVESFL